MEAEELKLFLGIKVRIYLINNLVYTGFIRELKENSILFTDKFGALVVLPYSEISRLAEWKERSD